MRLTQFSIPLGVDGAAVMSVGQVRRTTAPVTRRKTTRKRGDGFNRVKTSTKSGSGWSRG